MFKAWLIQRGMFKDHPLHKAVVSGDVERVAEMMDDPTTKVDERDYLGNTALMLACNLPIRNNSLNIATMLLQAGANPNAESLEGLRALSFVMYRKNTGLLRLLLRSGASVHFKTRHVPGISNARYFREGTFLHYARHLAGWPEGLRILEERMGRHTSYVRRWNVNARLKRRGRERSLVDHVWGKKGEGHAHVRGKIKGYLNHGQSKLMF